MQRYTSNVILHNVDRRQILFHQKKKKTCQLVKCSKPVDTKYNIPNNITDTMMPEISEKKTKKKKPAFNVHIQTRKYYPKNSLKEKTSCFPNIVQLITLSL